VYTSGTTGTPKGVMISHQAMLFTIGSLCDYLRLDASDRILSVLPLAFTYGLYQLLTATAVGATLVLERSFTYPARVLERLAATEATTLPGVPSIFARLVAMHRKEPLRFPSVRRVTNAAAALPEAHLPVLGDIFPNAALYPMYGQTECARACFLDPALVALKPGSVGKAIPGTELVILSPEGAKVAAGEVGILHVRGPHVMVGYWQRPEETARTLVPGRLPGERMLCTHDWFRVDEEGDHYFVGRSDDIIKTRGEKVSPAEVESVLCGIDGVVEAAVIGVPDEIMGEAVRAHVVLEEGATLGVKDLEAACRQRLEIFMVPRDILIETELPKTPNGKVSKRELRARVG
ncbi:MAG TPA: fatty acid--CoA ligase family protein, partial [Polyangiaceae bacterium]|nr:fatty acid--CoA ligase family protein [Polyangiaceae bacterium]